jgi:3-methyladenine DNA glycosylase AlkD
LADRLKTDNHDLIHKSVGWMIREIGRRDYSIANAFVSANAAIMPRTMLRYAIEQFPDDRRKVYMQAAAVIKSNK